MPQFITVITPQTSLNEQVLFQLDSLLLDLQSMVITAVQGWARDVKPRDRDETETLTPETETLASPAETRPRH